MSNQLKKFQGLLRELFQFDSADLDFGIYRILNARRGLFEDWIDNKLPAAVRQALSSGAAAQSDAQAKRLEELAARLREEQEDDTVIDGDGRLREGITGKTAREYRELWESQQASAQPSGADAREADIYNRLYDFFRRYYEDGDFLSLRRYGADDAYAVPYNGQEVMLHWANRDQYYVKTGEHFTDYRFRAGDKADAWHVEFRLRQAETDRDNTKAADKRHFFFDLGAVEADADSRTLVVPVAWRAATAAEAEKLPARNPQDAINEDAERKLLAKQAVKAEAALLAALKVNVSEGDDKPQSLLARHLRRYTRRNTSDFFIHKDLRGFLTRELDYWLKAEVLKLDTLLVGGEQPAQAWLQTLGCLRNVATTIIDFVARIEDFQKRLYEKRKFITQAHWCLTLDHVERAGLTGRLVEILNTTEGGKTQKAEWKQLFAIDEVEVEGGKPGWKEKVAAEFLRSQPYLVLDTVNMPQEFTDALLASFEDLDAATDGLLVHGDNWQALMLMHERKQADGVYIDPPYNKGGVSDFRYKDDYKSSSWLSMMSPLIEATLRGLKHSGILFSSIDENEGYNLLRLAESYRPGSTKLLPALTNLKGNYDAEGFVATHEYVVCVAKSSLGDVGELAIDEEKIEKDWLEDEYGLWKKGDGLRRTGADAGRKRRPRGWFPVFLRASDQKIYVTDDDKPNGSCDIVIWPRDDQKGEMSWSWGKAKITRESHNLLLVETKNGYSIYKKQRVGLSGIPTRKPKSFLYSPEYSSTSGGNVVEQMFGRRLQEYTPKSVSLVRDLLRLSAKNTESPVFLDYFAGSGTTGHAAIQLARDGMSVKYTLVEAGAHFEEITKPRVLKAIYSVDWDGGRPVSRNGSSHALQYVTLESYEDTLSNLRLRADIPGQGGLDLGETPDIYRLGYWLDVDTSGSASLLDVERLECPYDYALTVHDGKSARTQVVDLAETFNFLIGLVVRRRQVLDRDGRRYLLYVGRTRADDVATAVLWRDITGWAEDDFAAERDWVAAQAPFGDATKVFVNGDSAIPGAQSLDAVFHARMFAPVH